MFYPFFPVLEHLHFYLVFSCFGIQCGQTVQRLQSRYDDMIDQKALAWITDRLGFSLYFLVGVYIILVKL